MGGEGGGGCISWHTKDSFPTYVAHSMADKLVLAVGWASVPFCGLSMRLLGFCHDCGLSSQSQQAGSYGAANEPSGVTGPLYCVMLVTWGHL